tara:strand:- start:297 stop:542 length:246 start_codon:yes stop_codon:yes gene_type:complete
MRILRKDVNPKHEHKEFPDDNAENICRCTEDYGIGHDNIKNINFCLCCNKIKEFTEICECNSEMGVGEADGLCLSCGKPPV